MLDFYPLEIARPERDIVTTLTEVPLAERRAMLAGPFDARSHRRHFSALRCLHEIESGGTPVAHTDPVELRVAVWNAERLRSAAAASALLASERPDVVLLSEVDKGMARSDNRHGLADLAGLFGHQYVYGVEFVELGLGDPEEAAAHEAQE